MSENEQLENSELKDYILELSNLNNYITQYSSGAGITEISLQELYDMLKNPFKNISKIQNTSRFFSNRFGVVKDVNESFKTLPSLNYHLVWSNFENPKKIRKYEEKIYSLLDTLNIVKVVRDGLGEQAEVGTVVCVNRKDKFIQFLDLDILRIQKQINGQWIPEVDLSKITGTPLEIKQTIDSLPEEVTMATYLQYKKGGTAFQFVELPSARVLNIRGKRNYPYGFPLTLSAWGSILHKSLMEQVEKSVADRKIKVLLAMVVRSINPDKEGYKPPKKELIDRYFKDLNSLIQKKDKGSGRQGSETTGTGTMILPDFLALEQVELDTEMFPKELYDKIQNDIFANLGVSSALVYGSGDSSSYGVAQINNEKFLRYIYAALEDWEYYINDIIKSVLPADLSCRFYFDRTTVTDRDKDINIKKEFYMQTGVWIPWAEAVLGVPYTYALGVAEYQDKVLKLDQIIKPPQNAFTQSGGETKPKNGESDDGDGNKKAKGSNSNNIPSPSD